MHITKLRDVAVIHCVGRIVFADEATALRNTVEAILSDYPQCVLNLRLVSHIDAHGLGILAKLCAAARRRGGSLKLSNLNRRCRELFNLTGIASAIEIYASEDEALRACEQLA
ncbi:MAG TPA: STAS domain-containing protein [Terriglobales bacterium]|nr:STAS domain-containing protein [Terriglobales bacterium]